RNSRSRWPLAGSQQANPNFWVDPKNGVTYQVTAQEPQYQIDSLDALRNLPILGGTGVTPQIVANVANITRSNTSSVVDHYNIRPVINIYGNVDGKTWGLFPIECNNWSMPPRRIYRREVY